MELTSVVFHVVSIIISLYSNILIFKVILDSNDKMKGYVKAFILLGYFLLSTLTFGFKVIVDINSTVTVYINIVMQIILSLAISTMYVGKLKKKLIICVLFLLLKVLTEVITGLVYGLIIEQSVSSIVYDNSTNLIGLIISNIVTLVILQYFNLHYKKEKINIIQSLQVIIIPLCSITLMVVFSIIIMLERKDIEFVVLLSVLILVFMNIFFYYLLDKLKLQEQDKLENELLKVKSTYYIKQQNDLNKNYEDIRILKHDLKNEMIYIKAQLIENSKESLQKLNEKLDEFIGETEITHNYSNNPTLNIILNYKLSLMTEKNIPFDIKVNLTDDSVVDDNNIFVVLGNSLDNAIENYDTTIKDEKLIIRIFDNNTNLYIKISNPYNQELKFKNGLPITRKQNTKMHGIGLKSIQRIVDNNNGHMRIFNKENIFKLEIVLFNNSC